MINRGAALRLALQSRLREWPLAFLALIASLLVFAITAKIAPYMPDPGHRLAVTITKLSNEGRKAAVPIHPASTHLLPLRKPSSSLLLLPPYRFQNVIAEKFTPPIHRKTPLVFVRPPPSQS